MDRRVGVLLRVEHPHHQVGHLDQPLDLEVVADLGGVVVGQVEQHQPLECRPASRPPSSIESRATWWRGGMPSQSSSSVARLGAPGAGGGPRRGRASYADRGEVEPGQGVERRGLAGAGRAGQRDDGVVAGQPQPGARPGRRRRPRRRPRRRRAARAPASTACSRPCEARVQRAPRPRTLRAPATSPLTTRSGPWRTAGRRPGGPARAAARRSRSAAPRASSRSTKRCRSWSISASTRRSRSSRALVASRRTAWSPKTASSSFWPTTAEPPAMPTSAPVTPPVEAKTTTISATESPLTPNARKRAVVRLSAPSLRTRSSTPYCQSRTIRSARVAEVARGAGEVDPALLEHLPARGDRAPRGVGALGGRLGVLEHQRLEAGLDGDGDPLGLLRLAADRVGDAVAQPADLGLQVRSSSPVPTKSCHRASTSPRSRVPSAEASSTSATAWS